MWNFNGTNIYYIDIKQYNTIQFYKKLAQKFTFVRLVMNKARYRNKIIEIVGSKNDLQYNFSDE